MDITPLVQAVQTLNASDAFKPGLGAQHWQVLAPYLERQSVRAGDRLIGQGDMDRCAYFLEQGNLQAYASGAPPEIIAPRSFVRAPWWAKPDCLPSCRALRTSRP